MEDKFIVDMYFQRNEEAIEMTQQKYGKYLLAISQSILKSREDSEECVNDTYKRAWDTIPPNKPERLGAYLGKIARNLSINRYNFNNAEKRNKNLEAALSEMEDFLPSPDFAEETAHSLAFSQAMNKFLRALPEKRRNMFIQRYFYLMEIRDIADAFGTTKANVRVCLLRTREKLKKYLEKEGIFV